MATVWVNKWTFKVTHPVSGRSQTVTIPGIDKLGQSQVETLVAWQTEETLAELTGQEPNVRKAPFSKVDQHDLGKMLVDIEATKRHVKETGHGRYY